MMCSVELVRWCPVENDLWMGEADAAQIFYVEPSTFELRAINRGMQRDRPSIEGVPT